MTTVTTGPEAAGRIDALDLEPIVFKLMHPEPGQPGMTLAEADQAAAAYRCYLKLCAWYPDERIVPSRQQDAVWHAHILDTAKYAADCDAVFGEFLHHFPYLGLRGEADVAAWNTAYARTRELSAQRFGTQAAEQGSNGGSCTDHGGGGGLCVKGDCEKAVTGARAGSSRCEQGSGQKCNGYCDSLERPRPDRAAAPA